MGYISEHASGIVKGIIGLNYKISGNQIKPDMEITSLPGYKDSDMVPILNAISSSFGNVRIDDHVLKNETVKIEDLMGVAEKAYVKKVFFEVINDTLGLLAWMPEVNKGGEIERELSNEGYSWDSPIGKVEDGLRADSMDSILLRQELEKKLDIEISDDVFEKKMNKESTMKEVYNMVLVEVEKQ